MALALLAFAAVPAAAYELIAGTATGDEVRSGGKVTMGGKLGGYGSLLQASNSGFGETTLILECCGEAASLAGDAANGINLNEFSADDLEAQILAKYGQKNMCTKASADAVAEVGCNYAYSFKNKNWADVAYAALCVPSDVCSIDVVGMTKGTKIGYSVVEQILNSNAGDLMYAGYGPIGNCLDGMNAVNVGKTSKFVKQVPSYVELVPGIKIPTGKNKDGIVFEGMKEQGLVQMLGTCEPTADNGMLYVYKNKFWDADTGLVNIAGFLDEKAEQEKMQQIEEEKAKVEDQIESAEDKATELGLLKEKPATKPAAAPPAPPAAAAPPAPPAAAAPPAPPAAAAPPAPPAAAAPPAPAATEPAVTLDPMEKLEEIANTASKAKEAAEEAEETHVDPETAAAKVLGAALDKAEETKAEEVTAPAELAKPSATIDALAAGVKELAAAAPAELAKPSATLDAVAAGVKDSAAAMQAAAEKTAADLAASQEAAQKAAEEAAQKLQEQTEQAAADAKEAADKLAAQTQAAADKLAAQTKAALKETANKLTAQTQAAQEAAEQHVGAVAKATEEQAAAVKKAAETHAAAIQQAAEDHSAALKDAIATGVASTEESPAVAKKAAAAVGIESRRLTLLI
ncbi:unnamed protein product [Effrenium voratum]|nr:unnamed protein product [Effrenium voratum]